MTVVAGRWDEEVLRRVDLRALDLLVYHMHRDGLSAAEIARMMDRRADVVRRCLMRVRRTLSVPSPARPRSPGRAASRRPAPVEHAKPKPKVPSLQQRTYRLHASPHWPRIESMTAWFTSQPHAAKQTPPQLVSSQEEVEKVLRLDMSDEAGCEERLGRLVKWAAEDAFWQANLLSLAALRKVRDGVMKWQNIEAQMIRRAKEAQAGPAKPKVETPTERVARLNAERRAREAAKESNRA